MAFFRIALLSLVALLAAAGSMAQDERQTPSGKQTETPKPQRFRMGGNAEAGNLVHQVSPVYPDLAKQAHISGTVVLHAVIAKDGTIEQLEYVSGPPLLMHSAMDAVRQWRYRPVILNGEVVEVDTTISVVYPLGSSPPSNEEYASSSPNPPGAPHTVQAAHAPKSVEIEGVAIDSPADGLLRVFVSPKLQATRILKKVEPVYPEEAKKAGIEGTVLFHAIIAKDGSVKQLTLQDGNPILAKPAEEAVREWRYDVTPYASKDGKTRMAEVDTVIAVEFKLTK
jgi:TonB family protein